MLCGLPATGKSYLARSLVEQPVGHPHFTIDTSGDIGAAVNKILRMVQK
jgi:adenylate kinase family enzyme